MLAGVAGNTMKSEFPNKTGLDSHTHKKKIRGKKIPQANVNVVTGLKIQ